MTSITHIGAIQVTIILATGNGTIVTTDTSTNDLTMIHPIGHYRCPGRWKLVMAGITSIAGVDMTG